MGVGERGHEALLTGRLLRTDPQNLATIGAAKGAAVNRSDISGNAQLVDQKFALAIVGAESFTTGCAGFFVTTGARFFAIRCTGLLTISPTDFSVIT